MSEIFRFAWISQLPNSSISKEVTYQVMNENHFIPVNIIDGEGRLDEGMT